MKFLDIIVLSLMFKLGSQENVCDRINDLINGEGYFELMISPKLISFSRKQLRVMFDMNKLDNDSIRIIEEYPSNKTIFHSIIQPNQRYIDTNIVYEINNKYLSQYVNSNGTILATSVFKPWSGWMNCTRKYLGQRSVGTVLFPGSHDAGSYREPQFYDSFSPLTLIYNFVFTQDETIEEQLERGARYLDLRIANYELFGEDIWFINHSFIPIRLLSGVINQIKSFLSRWPNEILLLDLHRFPFGFWSDSTHDRLAKYLSDSFGPLLYRPKNQSDAWTITFNQLWASPARILLSYDDASIAEKYNFFPPVYQVWANADVPENLFKYLNQNIPKDCHISQMTSAMAELTPQISGVLSFRYGGLRNLADEVNSKITLDFILGNWGKTAQAVAVDYLSSTGIISAAILQNVERTKSHPQHNCR